MKVDRLASGRLRIVVLGYVVRGPLGGMVWSNLQYLMGLARLGHDVYFVEDSDDYPSCYDPINNPVGATNRRNEVLQIMHSRNEVTIKDDQGNDMPAAMMALNASYRVKGEAGERDIPARDFYRGAYATSLGKGEILTSIRIPAPADGHGYAYEKQKRKIGDYATAVAAVVLTLSGGKGNSVTIALTNVGDTPLLATEAAVALIGIVSGTFQRLVAITAFFLALNYGICCVALVVLRRREPHRARPFVAPGYPWSAYIVLSGAVALVVGTLVGDTVNGGLAIALLIAGLIGRMAFARRGARRSVAKL